MEKVRKQENKQPGCSRRDAFALKCPKLHVFLLFLPFLARSSVKWTLRDTKRHLQNAFQRRKRFAQAPPSSPIIIAPITRLSISMVRIDVQGRIDKTLLPWRTTVPSVIAYNRCAAFRTLTRKLFTRSVALYRKNVKQQKEETLVPRDKPRPENRIFPFLSRLSNTRRCGIDVEGYESFDNGYGNIFPTLNIQDAWTPHNRAAWN